MSTTTIIYHITTENDWTAAQSTGSYQADTLTAEGFIHCSTRQQVVPVANRFYHSQPGLVLLAVDIGRLNSGLIWENLEGGQEQFPHIYGPLNLDAVLHVTEFNPKPDGTFVLPEIEA
jgi:uncharacterized protein (DUF952 family)